MANQYEDDDDDFNEVEDTQQSDNGPAGLRKKLKQTEKQNKALLDELNSIKADLRSRSVSELLDKKGVPTKVAKFIPSDISTPEQVDAWLSENADIFGFSQPEETAQAEQETNADIAAYKRIAAATATATSPAKNADIANKLASDSLTRADLDSMTGNTSGRFRR